MSGFLILDMKHGGMDGFYFKREDAVRIAERWKKDLCHDQVLVVEARGGSDVEISSYCFLADRRMHGGLHGPQITLNAKPPEDVFKRRAITICSELLRDLYSSDYDHNDIIARSMLLLEVVVEAAKRECQ